MSLHDYRKISSCSCVIVLSREFNYYHFISIPSIENDIINYINLVGFLIWSPHLKFYHGSLILKQAQDHVLVVQIPPIIYCVIGYDSEK